MELTGASIYPGIGTIGIFGARAEDCCSAQFKKMAIPMAAKHPKASSVGFEAQL
jgi:hypothetical protein